MIDRLDRKILQILQEDATIPVAEIGRRVGLSTTPCWRRIQKLEEDGVILRRVAVLDPKKINARVTAFVAITTNQHNEEWLRRFAEVLRDFPEVVEFYRMAGQIDYLLRVVVPDIEAYDAFYKRLIAKIEIADVSSSFAMEQIKYTTALPLNYIVIDKEKARIDDDEPKRRGPFPSDAIITLISEDNPKERTARERFSKYRTGMSVEEYIRTVGDRALAQRDLAWDTKMGYILVS